MVYSIIIKDQSGNPLPGSTIYFYDSSRNLITSFPAGSATTYSFDSDSDSDLFTAGNTVKITAPGYSDADYGISSFTGNSIVVMQKSNFILLILGIAGFTFAFLNRKKLFGK